MGRAGARAGLLGLAGAAVAGMVSWVMLRLALQGWTGFSAVRVEEGLGFLVPAAAGLLCAWASLVLLTATVRVLRSLDVRYGAPDAVLRSSGLTGRVAAGLIAAASIGLAPASVQAAPALTQISVGVGAHVPSGAADPSSPVDGADRDARDAAVPVPGWTPTPRAAPPAGGGEVGLVSAGATTATVPDGTVVVHRGDTLWDIAARHLGPHATDQDVAEAWPRWYALNREVVGDDPDHILPGQRLVVPAAGADR